MNCDVTIGEGGDWILKCVYVHVHVIYFLYVCKYVYLYVSAAHRFLIESELVHSSTK